MKTTTLIVTILGMLLAAGCGKNTGFLIKPVPLDETLQETTVARDPGLFVADKIVIVDVDGMITNVQGNALLSSGENPVSLFVEKLDKAQNDGNVKAVILRINSPGGGVTASDIMYHRLLEFRRVRKVPVVAIIQDVGASGAYYIACGATCKVDDAPPGAILAMHTSVTGSIGVILQTVSFAGSLKKLGIDAKAITSGQFKDMGSPLKPLDPKDHKLLQIVVDEFYNGFVNVVSAGRPKLTVEQVRNLADGRVYTGRQAMDNGLIDQLGYMDDAIELAKKSSGAANVKVVIYHRPLGYKPNAYAAASVPTPEVNLLNVNMPNIMEFVQPQFLYLWTGHTPGK